MSAPPVDTIEPDPAATSLPNDEIASKEAGDKSATVEGKEAIESEVKLEETTEVKDANGAVSVTDEKSTKTTEEKPAKKEAKPEQKEEFKRNGDHKKGEHNHQERNGRNFSRHYNSYPKGGPNHSKYDPSVLESTDDHKQIRAQVEFYFGDANLPSDQYLWELTDGPTNKPVPIATICKFGRMKRFEPYSSVVAALKESQFLQVEGEEGEETVNRKTAYDPNLPRHSAAARSVYVKGFGAEERSSQFDIEAFFAPYGPTNAVRLRRSQDKEFKGSVFVEFADEETAKKFLTLDPKPMWKGKHELEIKSKKEYTDGKEEDIREGRMEPSESFVPRRGRGGHRGNDSRDFRGGRGNSRGRGDRGDRDRGRLDRGDRDPDDWKKRREDDRASGFKNDRKNDRGRGRGGNERGGRRGGRDDNGSRNDEQAKSDVKKDETSEKAVKEENAEKSEEPAVNEKKRVREDDDGGDQPAKKIDTKPEVKAEAS